MAYFLVLELKATGLLDLHGYFIAAFFRVKHEWVSETGNNRTLNQLNSSWSKVKAFMHNFTYT